MFWREKEAAYLKAFGDELKEMLVNADLLTREQAWGEKKSEGRELLQKVGTNLVRDQIDPDFWVKKMEGKIEALESMNKRDILIHDVRFRNESEMIKRRRGVLILLQRPSTIYLDNHRSETEFMGIKPDFYLFNNGSLEDLRNSVYSIMERIHKNIG